MINPRYLAGLAMVAGFTLSGCNNAGTSESCGCDSGSEESCSSIDVTGAVSNAPDIHLTYVEFLVPAERTPDLLAQKPEFDALLSEAKAGKVGVVSSAVRVRDMQQATIKSVVMVRFPTSHALLGAAPVAKEESAAAETDTPAPAPAPESVLATDANPQLIPQDFEVQETGVSFACTPTLLPDGKAVELDMEPKGTAMEIASGEHPDACGFPCQPLFSVNEVKTRLRVKNHVATHIATFQPLPNSKETRQRVVFIRADWAE